MVKWKSYSPLMRDEIISYYVSEIHILLILIIVQAFPIFLHMVLNRVHSLMNSMTVSPLDT